MYLDPGFGGMLIQIIVAIVAAGGAMAFALRKKISGMFKKNKKEKAVVMSEKGSHKGNDDEVIDALSNQ